MRDNFKYKLTSTLTDVYVYRETYKLVYIFILLFICIMHMSRRRHVIIGLQKAPRRRAHINTFYHERVFNRNLFFPGV